MKNVLLVVAGFVGIGLLVFFNAGNEGDKSFDKCVVKGIAFYKESGIVGRFNSGNKVADIVKRDCMKSHDAFDY